jgi:GTP diphosphokinase / guanosine-3',5'-bis(diphosphate) 3'-diphosphatase
MKSRGIRRADAAGKSRAPYQFVLDRVKSYHPHADLNLIRRACEFAIAAHRGETRQTGSPFVVHPLRVAYLLAQMNMDEATVAAGALHDTIEDTSTTYEQLRDLFGDEVATLVNGVTNVSRAEQLSKDESRAGGFRHMIEAMLTDIRILFIKFCDRLHNMRTLSAMSPGARQRIARETMDLYVPLAARFGIYWLWRELEELSFRYLEPEKHQAVKTLMGEAIKKLQPYEAEVLRTLKGTLAAYSVEAVVKPRHETVYRIHMRMITEKTSIGQLDGIMYFRVLVTDIPECYSVLGVIHSLWRAVPGSFKDYIQMPKANQYQSLHTTVFGPQGRPVQLQIRTRDMDRLAERGVTAQWYPEQRETLKSYYADLTGLISKLTEAEKEDHDPLQFARTMAQALYADEVRVFTPKGDVKELPKGATALDFAYAIHTHLGHECIGVLVNGNPAGIDYVLHGGEVVQILTSDDQKPQEDWLAIVRTLKAKRKIRQYLKSAVTAQE